MAAIHEAINKAMAQIAQTGIAKTSKASISGSTVWFRGIEAAMPFLEKSDAASIVVIGSVAAVEEFMMPQTYNAIKAAVIVHSQQLALALGGGGARGLAHVLMLEALDEMGIKPVAIAGTSIGAVVGAIAAWVIRVGVAVPRPERGSTTRIDAFALNEPWKRLVRDAQQAEQNFQRALHGTPQGPLRDRLGEIRAHLNEGVAEVWEIAKSGNAVGMGRAQINRPAVEGELAETRRLRAAADSPSLAATEEALLMQLATADRMEATLTESESRLRLLNAGWTRRSPGPSSCRSARPTPLPQARCAPTWRASRSIWG